MDSSNLYKPQLMAKALKDIWDDWGIELLMAVSCSIHVVLTLFGSSRRRMTASQGLARFLVLASFHLANYVATVIIGKLTIIHITSESIIDTTDGELKGFLAPLLLVQLGSHDAITAYSIEDVRMGARQFITLIAHLASVLYILLRTWNLSLVSYLYFPLFLAGTIKSVERVWAMYKSLSGSSGITPSQFETEAKTAASILDICNKIEVSTHHESLKMITTAYFHFICRRPHFESWINMYPSIHKPTDNSYNQECEEVFQVADYKPTDNSYNQKWKEVFQVADFELGFMYDMLYTKFPFVYTCAGLALRLISLLSLISCSIAFACWFKDSFVYYVNAGFTLVVLGVIITLELYQIYMLFFSEWAIIKIIEYKYRKDANKSSLLNFLAPRSVKWKRWSKTLGQFSFINYCIKYDRICCEKILNLLGWDVKLRKYFRTTSLDVTKELKQMLFEEMTKLDIWKGSRPVSESDEVEKEWWGVIVSFGVEFKCSVKRTVSEQSIISDKNIMVWHIATEICYQDDSLKDSNKKREMARNLSKYMMYILAVQPQMLSISTSEIVFEDACDLLLTFINELKEKMDEEQKKSTSSKVKMDEKQVCSALQNFEEKSKSGEEKQTKETESVEEKQKKDTESVAMPAMKSTEHWHFLKEAKELSKELLNLGDRRWEVIWRVWVDMLSSAAYNCKPDQHSEQLRRGGEILTHVWLILLHHKDSSIVPHDDASQSHPRNP